MSQAGLLDKVSNVLTVCELRTKWDTDLLGFFNDLLVSESCCIVATWLPCPDCPRECTVDEKQNSRKDPQALAVMSLEIAPY